MDQNTQKLVTVIGGSGFIGSQLVQKLTRLGFRVRVGVRRPDLAGHLIPLGSVGQIQLTQVNIRNSGSVVRAVAGSDVVVNLVGLLFESGRQRFRAVHSKGAGNVARAATEAGVAQLVHMSALGASSNSPSSYATSKALGESEVLALFPSAIILRPSVLFGSDDRFFNLFGMLARLMPVLPVIGATSKFQPVYVGDVAEALALAVSGRVEAGKIYELGGPDIETMNELMQRVLDETGRNNMLMRLPMWLAKFDAKFLQIMPRPLLTVDQVIQLGQDNIVGAEADAQARNFKAFGITPKSMDEVLPTYMWRFRKHGQFEQARI